MAVDSRTEPRKQVITQAAFLVVSEFGPRAATFRRIAARARVPLGSLTYYFSSIDELLDEAFSSYEESLRREAAVLAKSCIGEPFCAGSHVAGLESDFTAFSSPAFFDLLALRERQGRAADLLADLSKLSERQDAPPRQCGCPASVNPVELHLAITSSAVMRVET